VRRTFPDASTCPGVTSPPPLDALRTFNLPQFAYAKRSYDLLFPVLAQGEEDFKLFLPALARGEEVFSISFLPALARGEEVFLISFSPTPARGEEVFSISFSPDGGQKVLYLCLRSPGGGVDLKNFIHVPPIAMWR